MKKTIKMMALLLFAATIMSMATSCDSYEKRMAKCEKAATEFKASLGTNATILAEVIDSTAQEIIYIKWGNSDVTWDFIDDGNSERYGIIEVHNYTTGITENLFTNWSKRKEYMYYKNHRLINDRLFLNFWDGRYGTAVVYVNVRDNSIHDVAFPEEAEISDKQIVLTEMYLIHDSEFMYEIEHGHKKYVISTELTDTEYETAAKKRAEDISNIEKKAMEEDKRHRKIAKNEHLLRYYLDGYLGSFQLRMSGLIGNVSVIFSYDDMNDGYLSFETSEESWEAKIMWANSESGRMIVALEGGKKGELVGYLHGQSMEATYEGTYIDPSGNETPFKFFDDFQYWGF